jgi:hypothetical protein
MNTNGSTHALQQQQVQQAVAHGSK